MFAAYSEPHGWVIVHTITNFQDGSVVSVVEQENGRIDTVSTRTIQTVVKDQKEPAWIAQRLTSRRSLTSASPTSKSGQ